MSLLTKDLPLLIGGGCLAMALLTAAEAKGELAGPPGRAAENRNMRLVGHHDMQARSIYNGHVREQGGRFIANVGYHDGAALNPDTGVMEANGNAIIDVSSPPFPSTLCTFLRIPPTQGSAAARSLQPYSGAELGTGDPNRVFMHREVGADIAWPEKGEFSPCGDGSCSREARDTDVVH